MLFKEAWEIRNDILNFMTNNLSKVEGSYNFDVASAVSFEISNTYKETDELYTQLFPWTVTKEPYLTYHLMTYGLERLEKTKATGVVVINGKISTIIQEGTIVISRLGVSYTTVGNFVIGTNGKATCNIISITGGIDGNCGIGEITSFQLPDVNIYSVTNPVKIVGGSEIETVESCRERMKLKASRPAHSGNRNQYENWLLEVGGLGKIVVLGAGEHNVVSGNVECYVNNFDGTTPTENKLSEIKNYLNVNNKIPINDNLIVKALTPFSLNITFSEIKVESGTMTKEKFITEFKDLLNASLQDKKFIVEIKNSVGYLENSIVPTPKVGNLVLNMPDVILYDNLLVNGSSSNVSLLFNQNARVGTVEVTNFVNI